MKRALLLSSIVAISTVIGSGAQADTFNSIEGNTFIIQTNGTEEGVGANVIPTYQAITASQFTRDTNDATSLNDEIQAWVAANNGKVADVANTFNVFSEKLNEVNKDITDSLTALQTQAANVFAEKQVWIEKQLGFNTSAMDVPDILGTDFTDQTSDGKVGLIDAVLQNKAALSGKVDAVVGKGLSTNDYTDAEKTKLAGLSNYDDTALSGRVTTLETAGYQNAAGVNSLIGTSIASGAIKTALDTKANADDVYTKTEAETIFAALADDNTFTGLNTFKNAGGVNVSKDGTTEYTANMKVDDVTVGSESGKALIVSGVDGIQAANFVANNGEFVTASGNFVAGDDKIEIKSGTDTMFKADNSGNIIAKGTVNINGATLAGSDSTLSSNKKVVSENGFEIDLDNSFLAGALKLNGNTVNTIDTGADAITSGNGTTIATTATVLTSAENATYTAGASATNTANGTLNSAIASLDSAIGNRGTLSTTNNHLTTTGTIVANLNALDSAIGNTSFSGTNANGAANLTMAVNALDAEIGADTDYGTSPINGVSASNSIKANVATVNNALGDVSTHAVNGSSATDLSTAVKDLNTNMNNVLGGVYKADGTFDNTVLMNTTTQNGFETGATDLSDALKKYADNVQAATGTTFAADGSFTNAYAKPTAVDYDGLDNSQSIVSAVSQLDKNIGTAVTTAYNGVAANKTVNENISAVNATIGDITTLAAGTGSTGNALTNGTGTAAANVVTALNNIDATLGQIHGLKNGNSHLKANSNLANGTTVEQHLVALDDAIGNRNISSANADINTATAADMATAMETTGNLIGSMDFDGTQYLAGVTNLTDAVRTLDNNIERVENRLEKVEYNLKSGLAAVSALSALVPNARDCGNTQLSVGTGVYADRVGVAVGGFHYFNDHVLFNAGASYGGTRDWAFRAGLTFGI